MTSHARSCLAPVSGNATLPKFKKPSVIKAQNDSSAAGPNARALLPAKAAPLAQATHDTMDPQQRFEAARNSGSNAVSALPESSPPVGVNRHRPGGSSPGTPIGKIRTSPAGKIALEDLLGLLEEKKPLVPEASPMERVTWRIPRSPPTSSRPDLVHARQMRKRARSSSPIMSPRHHAAMQVMSEESDSISSSKDPTIEFLRMYSIPRLVNSGDSQGHSAITAELSSALKGTGQEPRGDHFAGLRKTASCGPEWPTSDSKRRKLEPLTQLPEAPRRNVSDRVTLVNRLLQRMQDGRSEFEPAALPVAADSNRKQADVCSLLPPMAPQFEPGSTSGHRQVTTSEPRASAKEDKKDRAIYFYTDEDASLVALRKPEPAGGRLSQASPLECRAISRQSTAAMAVADCEDDLFDDIDFQDEGSQEVARSTETPRIKNIVSIHNSGTARMTDRVTMPQASAVADAITQDPFDVFDDEDDDFVEALSAAMPPASVGNPRNERLMRSTAKEGKESRQRRTIDRYLVKAVDSSLAGNATEKTLVLTESTKETEKSVILRGSWSETACNPGDFVHIIGCFDAQGRCVIDENENMLILHPDHLISSTVIADSFTCARRAVLQDRVKATNQTSSATVYGQLIHQIFQDAMQQKRWDIAWLTERIDCLLQRSLDDLYRAQLGLSVAREHLLSKMPAIQEWAGTYMADSPRAHATIRDINGPVKPRRLAVKRLLEVEEHVWSPMFGLKGNIDVTVEAVLEDNGTQTTVLAPLELKTGINKSPNHHAQTALYTLLLSDRYDVEVAAGILYYTESSDTIRIPAIRNELRHMIQQRNTLAACLKDRLALPPMKRDAFQCQRCYAKMSCFVYHKATEAGDRESSGLPAAFDKLTGHMSEQDQGFFRRWDDLLMKEERDMMKFRRELWTMTGLHREKLGRCFSNVKIDTDATYEPVVSERINRYQYTFTKPDCQKSFSFVESQISIGEPIVISDEDGHYALANGYVMNVYKHRIVVAVDRKVRDSRKKVKGFHHVNNQVFAGMDAADEETQTSSNQVGECPKNGVSYRIDRDEFSNGMATARNNIIQLMDDSVFGSSKVRKLIIDTVAPSYRQLPEDAADTVLSQNGLNEDQRNAIQRVLSAKDYALVLGMPGTGKTTTIAQIIRALTRLGKSVLLTSYTHSAVDNILLKLKEDRIPILRLGAMAKIHPEIAEFAILDAIPKETLEKIRESYQKPQVVATTCLGVNHPVFAERIFDYCIVDEASQITLPVCIGPIRMARSFVLVGDHYQLTPLVKDDEAKQGGLDVSLFKYLSEAHPESVANLEHQYRMNSEITRLSSHLIYGDRLKPGNEETAGRRLHLSNPAGLKSMHLGGDPEQELGCRGSPDCWLERVVDPSFPLCFVATDQIAAAKEQVTNARIVNPTECLLVVQMVEALVWSGTPVSSIGVISFYRSQISLLRYALAHRPGIELHTVDKFQGRDKEVIIVSWVRSNDNGEVGELLQDWRRINVAITRARSKLILIGDTSTLRNENLLSRLIQMVKEEALIISLNEGDHEAHGISALTTQVLVRSSPIKPGVEERRSSLVTSGMKTQSKPEASPQPRVQQAEPEIQATISDSRTSQLLPVLDESNPPVKPRQEPRHARVGRRLLLKGRHVLQDIVNDIGV